MRHSLTADTAAMETKEIQGLVWLTKDGRIVAGPFISPQQARAARLRLERTTS
jgi:hypothetical protein